MTVPDLLALIPDAGEGHRIVYDRVETFQPYQSLPLPDGRTVPGLRNTARRWVQLGLDQVQFNDERVLDVGASLGVFSVMAARNGARQVIGYDTRLDNVRFAKAYAEMWGVADRVDFRCGSIELALAAELVGEVDIALCLSMIEYVNGPALCRQLARIVRKLVVVEGHSADDEGRRRSYASWLKFGGFNEVRLYGYGESGSNAPPDLQGDRRPILWGRHACAT